MSLKFRANDFEREKILQQNKQRKKNLQGTTKRPDENAVMETFAKSDDMFNCLLEHERMCRMNYVYNKFLISILLSETINRKFTLAYDLSK